MGRGVASSRSPWNCLPPNRPPVLILFPGLPSPSQFPPAAVTRRTRRGSAPGNAAASWRLHYAGSWRSRGGAGRGFDRSRGMHVPIGADRLHRHFELIKADHSRVEPPRLLSATFCKNGPRLRGGNEWLRPAPL